MISPADRSAQLVEIASQLASELEDFQAVKGPGDGDRANARFMKELARRAQARFGSDSSERRICGETGFRVDFYFEDEKTIVEVALGLPNPLSEFERDILKALVAKESCRGVERLVLISRAGGEAKCKQPGRAAFVHWALKYHDLKIDVYDLPGERRRRAGRGVR